MSRGSIDGGGGGKKKRFCGGKGRGREGQGKENLEKKISGSKGLDLS